jgi:hypothetical protein
MPKLKVVDASDDRNEDWLRSSRDEREVAEIEAAPTEDREARAARLAAFAKKK